MDGDIIRSTYGPEDLPPDPSEAALTASSGEEPALSVISDSLSEQEYSSDSGKGGSASDNLVTPPDSVNETEGEEVPATVDGDPWQMLANGGNYTNQSQFTAYSCQLGKLFPSLAMIFEFEIPQSIVGRLIGRFGSFLQKIKMTSGANIIVKKHHNGHSIKICAVEGVAGEIDRAVTMIRERFPLKKFPILTLEQTNGTAPILPAISYLPSNNKLNLMEGMINEVTVSCVVSLEHVFLNHPTHPTYQDLAKLHVALKQLYEQPIGTPKLARPFNPGVLCVAQFNEDDWYRTEVIAVQEENSQVTARLVDVGGYVQVPIDSLRQIRYDFVSVPFQATECRLANIMPINEEEGWSEDAVNLFKILANGYILKANVVGYATRDNLPLIHLYKFTEHSHLFLNEELVSHGYAKWIDDADYYVLPEAVDELCQEFGELSTDLTQMPMPSMPIEFEPLAYPDGIEGSWSDEVATKVEVLPDSSLSIEESASEVCVS